MIKIKVKKNAPKRAEVYERFLDGEDKKNFIRRIAEALIMSGKGDTDEPGNEPDNQTADEDR